MIALEQRKLMIPNGSESEKHNEDDVPRAHYGGTTPASMPEMNHQGGSQRSSRGSPALGSVMDPLLYEESPISKDRRKFLIVCVFDSVLTTMLWLLSTVTKGDDWPAIFFTEVNIFEPNFLKISLFDLVIVGVLRTALLLLFFAALRSEHWLPVAFTTTVTTGFIVVKILFFFKKDHGALPQYLVLLASFSVAWFELWLVPFRVLPGERRDVVEDSEPSVRHSDATSSGFRRNKRINDTTRRYPVTTDDDFRSALEYTTDEERTPGASKNKQITIPGFGNVDRQTALGILTDSSQQLAQLLNEVPLWKSMKNSDPVIRSRDALFYIRAEFHTDPKTLFLAAWRDNCLWNPQVKKMNYLIKIDAQTDVIHLETQPALGGYIASRHFVDIRRVIFEPETNAYTCVYTSIPTPLKPEEAQGGVRGHNHPNLLRIAPSTINEGVSIFEWIMNTDVKSNVPKALMKRGTVSFLSAYPKLLEAYIKERKEFYENEVV
ncbi:unnamed protein product [Bursaphelenchus xylophilus]|uniref:(pine wood nematode) hypothetical protein n=1 Tax=Bursaphelenchus xylophilus TaxID=6326 RepID=A0A1I7RZ35_BURXY|nr:unnamed protein product [Bursaphelenchus xylophilus]CAG9106898.1 unnamed protein product [Bursaphelenchus xylophilus]